MNPQIWINEQHNDFQIVALTAEALYFEDMDTQAADEAAKGLRSGALPDTVFGKDASHIPLRRLSKVSIDRNDDNDIELHYAEGKEKQDKTLSVPKKETRDNIYNALREATEARFDEFVDQYSRPRAAFASLATLTFFGVVTWLLAAAAVALEEGDEVDITGRKRGLKQLMVWALDFLGPWGVSVIGGLLSLLAVLMLVNRLRSPQLMYVLQSEPYKPTPAFVTSVKYALLLGVWALVVRAMVL